MVFVINFDIILINLIIFLWLFSCVIVLFSCNFRVCYFVFFNYVYVIFIRKYFCFFLLSCLFLRYLYVYLLSMVVYKFKVRVIYSNIIIL